MLVSNPAGALEFGEVGIDDDLLDDRTRETEAINWLTHILKA